MLSARFKPWHVPLFAAKYAWLHLRRFPVLVHFEVTMRCNAHCDFCDYWKNGADAVRSDAESYADAARYFNPVMITFTGGEPLLRRDLESLVAAVAGAIRIRYLALITHGAMLSPERARSLWEAGLNQFNISLDYLDAQHDEARGIPGLAAKILDTVPRMRALGIDGIRFNTVIKQSNLDQLVPIVERAASLGVGVSFSAYTDAKNGNRAHLVSPETQQHLEEVIAELLAFKRRKRGVIVSSDYYLAQVPRFFSGAMQDSCNSGVRTIHIDPAGQVRRCPDFPADYHWRDFKRYTPIDCNACYYACRGEAQAPLTIARVRDVMATAQ
ncbi:MAG TPA: radical SAM protein [Gemmatimonadaceae bacterium]